MTNAINLFGKMLAFSRLQINTNDIDKIGQGLDLLNVSPDIVPVVLDVLDDVMVDEAFFETLIEMLWQHHVAIIAVMDGRLTSFAKAHKIAVLPSDGKRIARLDLKQESTPIQSDKSQSQNDQNQENDSVTATSKNPSQKLDPIHLNTAYLDTKSSSLVHEQMLRSGQSVHHIGGDLIVTSSVNNGAEVVTDNNLHIYGKGQGRLVAGATGDENTRIFCQVFEPSLVSVAGTYCLRDDIPEQFIGKSVQVTFDKAQGLVFKLMS